MSEITYSQTGPSTSVGDIIDQLPTDDTPISEDDLKLADTLFGKRNTKFLDKIAGEFKDLFLAGFLFILLSIPYADKIISKIPIAAKSHTILLVIKALIFISLFWVIKNLNLARRT